MEALYKSKGRFGAPGAGREKRKECNKLKSRAKRDSLLATRRKMSIGTDLNVTKEAKSPISVKGKDKEAKPNDRLQRLREWQKARDEAKAKSKAQNKKPVFAVRGTGNPQTAPSFAFSAKKTILCASPKPARPAPVSRVTKPANHQAPKPSKTTKTHESAESVKPATTKPTRGKASNANPKPARQVMPTRHSVRIAAKQTAASASKQAPPVKEPTVRKKTSNRANNENAPPKGVRTSKRSKPQKKENTICESKKVPPVSQAPACDNDEAPLPTTPKKSYKPVHPSPLLQCRSASKQRREAMYVPDSMYMNDPAWIPGAAAPQATQPPSFEDAFSGNFSPFRFTAGSEGSKETKFDFTFRLDTGLDPIAAQDSKSRRSSDFSDSSMNASQITKNVSASMLENLITFSDTSDCPSSDEDSENSNKVARKSRSASKRRQSSVGTENQDLDSLSSPAAKSPKVGSQRRSSRKSRSSSRRRQPSQCEEENEGVVTSLPSCKNSSSPLSVIAANNSPCKSPSVPTKSPLRRSTRKSRSSSKKCNSLGVGVYSMEEEVVRNLELDYDKENAPQQEDSVNIPYFRELHADACSKLEQLCEVWEGKAQEFEQDQDTDNINKEDVLGQMRTTCCQARLLMRQKLHQYIGLVDMAESNSGERKTTTEDLQGFWDMVYFQVDGLYTKFTELADMESAGWQISFPSPKKPKLQKRRKAAPKKPKTAEDKERLEAARKKREAGRAKIRELRSKSNQQPADNDMLIIF